MFGIRPKEMLIMMIFSRVYSVKREDKNQIWTWVVLGVVQNSIVQKAVGLLVCGRESEYILIDRGSMWLCLLFVSEFINYSLRPKLLILFWKLKFLRENYLISRLFIKTIEISKTTLKQLAKFWAFKCFILSKIK